MSVKHHLYAFRCRNASCKSAYMFALHDLPRDCESIARKALANLGEWFPVSTHDWLCPECGSDAPRNVQASAVTLRNAMQLTQVVRNGR